MERTISVWSDRNIRGQIWGGRLWSVISVNSTEISLSICHMIAVLSTSRLYPAYENNYRTRGGLVQVCATECTVPLGTWNFRNFKREFLLNGECPVYFQLVVLFTAPLPPPHREKKKKKKEKETYPGSLQSKLLTLSICHWQRGLFQLYDIERGKDSKRKFDFLSPHLFHKPVVFEALPPEKNNKKQNRNSN